MNEPDMTQGDDLALDDTGVDLGPKDNLSSVLASAEAQEAKPTAREDFQVPIGPNVSMPLGEFRACADPRCRYCSGTAFQRFVAGTTGEVVDGKPVYKYKARPCGCALRGAQKKLVGERPSDPAPVRVEGNAEAVAERRARVKAKHERLLAELAAAEAEVTAVQAAFNDSLTRMRVEDEVATAMARGEGIRLDAARDKLFQLESELEQLRRAIAEQSAVVVSHAEELDRRLAKAEHASAVLEMAERTQPTRGQGAERRAAALRRRLDRFAAAHEGDLS